MEKRVYVVLTGMFSHPKYNCTYPVAFVNRKMFMPARWMAWQGKVGFFGGGLEEGETPEEGALREIREELPGFHTPSQENLVKCHEDEKIIVFKYDIGKIDQTLYQTLSSFCTEGLVDVLDSMRVENMKDEDFVFPVMRKILQTIFW